MSRPNTITNYAVWSMAVLFATLFVLRCAFAGSPDAEASKAIAQNGGTFYQDDRKPKYKEGEVLVKLRRGVVAKSPEAVARSLGGTHAKNFKSNDPQMRRWWVLKLPSAVAVDAVVSALSRNPNVEVVEPNYAVSTQATPDDTRFSQLWGLNNTGQTGGVADADIDAPEAWDLHTGSRNIVVAVIDTGVVYDHEDLKANMWTNGGEIPGNSVDDDGNGYVDDVYGYDFLNSDGDPVDDNGHGTHVAGTIGASGNNSVGVVGVNWATKIMALKFIGVNGYGWVDDAISALNYAVAMGAQVTNNSWGGTSYSQALEDAIGAANSAGVLFVAAAGNDNRDNDVYAFHPANSIHSNVVSVTATDHNDALAYFSNYGATKVHLGAPGSNILSTMPRLYPCFGGMCNSDGYGRMSGTSMAAPHVTGAAALLWARFPNLTVEEVKNRLIATVDPLASLQGKTVSGGRLNIASLLDMLPYQGSFTPYQNKARRESTVSYSLTLNSSSATETRFSFEADTLATGLTASVSPAVLEVPAGGTASVTVSVTTGSAIKRGFYPIRILIVDDEQRQSSAEAQLRVLEPEYSVLVSPPEKYAFVGKSAGYLVTVKSIDDYAGPIDLSATASDPNLLATMTPTTLNLVADGSASAALSIETSMYTAPQFYDLSVTAADQSTIISIPARLEVRAIEILPNSYSIAEIDPKYQASTNSTYTFYPKGINNSGKVVGWGWSTYRYANPKAFEWTQATGRIVPYYYNSRYTGINNNGHIGGHMSSSNWGSPAVHDPATNRFYSFGYSGDVEGLNDVNNAVAQYFDSSINITKYSLWNYSTQLKTPLNFLPLRINNKNQVTGVTRTWGDRQAVMYDPALGEMQLGTLGGTISSGADINNNGTVVGYSVSATGNCSSGCAFSYDLGLGMTALPKLSSLPATPNAINSEAFIAGNAKAADGSSRAVIWYNDAVVDLNSLIPAESGWVLEDAIDINDLGQIVGTGKYLGEFKIFVLTP